jgi:hypothetical protein
MVAGRDHALSNRARHLEDFDKVAVLTIDTEVGELR